MVFFVLMDLVRAKNLGHSTRKPPWLVWQLLWSSSTSRSSSWSSPCRGHRSYASTSSSWRNRPRTQNGKWRFSGRTPWNWHRGSRNVCRKDSDDRPAEKEISLFCFVWNLFFFNYKRSLRFKETVKRMVDFWNAFFRSTSTKFFSRMLLRISQSRCIKSKPSLKRNRFFYFFVFSFFRKKKRKIEKRKKKKSIVHGCVIFIMRYDINREILALRKVVPTERLFIVEVVIFKSILAQVVFHWDHNYYS